MAILNDITEQFRKPNNALVKLILINVILYAIDCLLYITAQISGSTQLFGLVYEQQTLSSVWEVFIRKPWTIITYFFSHSIPMPFHILFNMLGLYWFGHVVQDLIGSKRLTSIYLLGGIAAGVTYMLVLNFIPYFQTHHGVALVGASGSVYAVVIAAAVLVPDYRFYLILLGPVKISYIALAYIFFSVIGTVGSNAGGNVAHLGGALLGYLFVSQLRRGKDMGRPFFSFWSSIAGLFDRSKRIKVSYKNPNNTQTVSAKARQEEIDAILDKISKSGYESLTKEEKRKLFEASQQE